MRHWMQVPDYKIEYLFFMKSRLLSQVEADDESDLSHYLQDGVLTYPHFMDASNNNYVKRKDIKGLCNIKVKTAILENHTCSYLCISELSTSGLTAHVSRACILNWCNFLASSSQVLVYYFQFMHFFFFLLKLYVFSFREGEKGWNKREKREKSLWINLY